ncbi:4'-phosphopantetheinyl transferase EntD (siderophore biosynthesis) [Salinihabitans flavidus]|uniref:Enterobactin synthase component D n=1 Tax=Salinihabitans flavidus TaxID=569882 RepID=A0A1H8QTF1_9RHOB|nr:4'-phosphopantetheinyl transferase superfamily protein [Salinihabitans flavidus]SEO57248.1 4'-phosphopantetheinyl transferase EntD (siderophore biosynthesis) [Salinihabitans flavidus]
MTPVRHLRDLASASLPPQVGVAVTNPRLPNAAIYPEEAGAVTHARPERRREFAAGREAARQAMGQIGLDLVPLPAGRDRAPRWPSGVIGSIAHDKQTCIAIVARDSYADAVGVDVEADLPLEDDLLATICRPEERAWLQTQPPDRRGALATRIFSAKEAAFKCQYAVSGEMLDFHAMQVTFNANITGFSARLVHGAGVLPEGTEITGRIGGTGTQILTVAEFRHPREQG